MAKKAAPKSKLTISHFEVYVFDKKRWILHARFPISEREQALEEAHTVERQLMMGGKVVREDYYPHTNTFDELVIYISPRLKAETAAAAKAAKPAARPEPAPARAWFRRRRPIASPFVPAPAPAIPAGPDTPMT